MRELLLVRPAQLPKFIEQMGVVSDERRVWEHDGYVIDSWKQDNGFMSLYIERIVEEHIATYKYHRRNDTLVWTKPIGDPIKVTQETWNAVLDDPDTHFLRLLL